MNNTLLQIQSELANLPAYAQSNGQFVKQGGPDYEKLTTLLIEYCKELEHRVVALESRNVIYGPIGQH